MRLAHDRLARDRLASFLVSSLLAFAPSLATAETELTFSTALRATTDSNASLSAVNPDRSNSVALRLGVELVSETAISRLAFSGSGSLRADSNGNRATGFVSPNVALEYTRTVANADLALSARLNETELNDDDVTNFTIGPGTRRNSQISAALNWGNATPLGFGVSASLRDLSYQDAPGLTGNSRTRLGATARLDLTKVLTLNLGVSDSRFDPDSGAATRTTRSLDAGLTLLRPRGTLEIRLSADDTEDGGRERLQFRHQIELPDEASLSYNVGVSRGVTDDTFVTAGLFYSRKFELGELGVQISRDVSSDDDTDAETLQNRARIDWQQAITPTANLLLGLDWAQSIATSTDLQTTNARLSATWSQSLAQDWALDVGYVHRIRDSDLAGQSDGDQFFLELRRDFRSRF
jgi:hypothetical protein